MLIQNSFTRQQFVQQKIEQIQKPNAFDILNENVKNTISRREILIQQRRSDQKRPPLPLNKQIRQSDVQLNQTQYEFSQKSINDIHAPEQKSFIKTADQSFNDIQENNLKSVSMERVEQKPIFPPRQIFFDDPQKEQEQIQKIILENQRKNEMEKEQQKKLSDKKQNEEKQKNFFTIQTTEELEPKIKGNDKTKEDLIIAQKDQEKEKQPIQNNQQGLNERNELKQNDENKKEEKIDTKKIEDSESLFKKVRLKEEEQQQIVKENLVEVLDKDLKIPDQALKNTLQQDIPKVQITRPKQEDLLIVDLEELEVPKKQQEKPKQTSYGKYIQKYQDYIKMVNQIGNMVAGCIELFEAQKNVWMIPLFLIFKRMCQMRTQIYNAIQKEQNPFKITDFVSFKNSQEYKTFKEQFSKENDIVIKELSDVLVVAKRKLSKIDKTQAQKMEGFLNLNMEQNIKDQTFVYLYGQVYSKVKTYAVSPPLNSKKDGPKYSAIQWKRLQTLILTSLIILELPLFDLTSQSLAEDLIMQGQEQDQLLQLEQLIQEREPQVEKLKIRLQEAGFPL